MANPNTPIIYPDNTDGLVPIFNIEDVYYHDHGNGRYVPPVNSLVKDNAFGFHLVTFIDPVTYDPTLMPWMIASSGTTPIPGEGKIGYIGSVQDSYRCYLDSSVIPHPAAIENSLVVMGSETSYGLLFLGTDISPNGKVISKMYDASGTYLNDFIPLEIVVNEDLNNQTCKAFKQFYIADDLVTGEVVTLVAYNNANMATDSWVLKIAERKYVKSPAANTKYIIDVSLISNYLSETTPNTLEVPVGVNLDSIAMQVKVKYNDGSSKNMPVDGAKVRFIHDMYIPSVPEQKVRAVLSYRVDADEVCYDATGGTVPYFTKEYTIHTTVADGAYTVKLYAYPSWNPTRLEWTLSYYLYNLDRNISENVTNYVRLSPGSNPFDPTLIGVVQTFVVDITLSDVDPEIFKDYIHTQVIKLSLNSTLPRPEMDNWYVYFDGNDAYGIDTYAEATYISGADFNLSLVSEAESLEEWLNKFYLKTYPLYSPTLQEDAPLEPTHFILINPSTGVSATYPVSSWNTIISYNTTQQLGENLVIRWIQRTATTDLQLAVSAIGLKFL